MQFDTRDIRSRMDVYTADNVWLGEVRQINPRPVAQEGEQVGAAARQSSRINGELLGPMPTAPIGNPAPHAQSAESFYAAEPDDAAKIGRGSIIVGRWWGLLGRRTIPMEQVQTVSLERVVLKAQKDALSS
jgi:hypothetical protein